LLTSKTSAGAGKFLEVRRIFAPKFYKLVRKKLQKMTLNKKKTSAFDFWRHFFKIKAYQGQFCQNVLELVRISPNSTKKTPKMYFQN